MSTTLTAGLNHGLSKANRIITGHDASGKSTFVESPELLYMDVQGAYASARSYSVEKVPAPLSGDQDLKAYLSKNGGENITSHTNNGITIPNGVNMVAVNFAPGSTTAMHRTVSIDFGVCTHGEIELELDSGEKRVIGPGDTIVQRATMHRWTNLSKDKAARMIAVTIYADNIEVGGKKIEETFVTE